MNEPLLFKIFSLDLQGTSRASGNTLQVMFSILQLKTETAY